MEIDYSFWNYFLTLEKDTQILGRYVEFSKNDFATYSVEILKNFLTSSSEFEVVMKEIGKEYNDSRFTESENNNKITIETIKNFIDATPAISKIKNFDVCLNYYDLDFNPVKEIWSKDSWWHSYNSVKHNRTANYSMANLGNLLKSTSSLFLANLFLYEKYFHNDICSLEDNISIAIDNLPETCLFKLKNKEFYKFHNASYFT